MLNFMSRDFFMLCIFIEIQSYENEHVYRCLKI